MSTRALWGIAALVAFFGAMICILQFDVNQKLATHQHQVDEFCLAMMDFVQTQNVAKDGVCCGIQGGVEYDVVFIDFARQLAILRYKDENGKICFDIHRNVSPETLTRWSKNRRVNSRTG